MVCLGVVFFVCFCGLCFDISKNNFCVALTDMIKVSKMHLIKLLSVCDCQTRSQDFSSDKQLQNTV